MSDEDQVEFCAACGWPGEKVTRLSHTLWNIHTVFDQQARKAEQPKPTGEQNG